VTMLTKEVILSRLGEADDRRLVVTPILSRDQIGDASLDVRLGNEFLVLTRAHAGVFDYDDLRTPATQMAAGVRNEKREPDVFRRVRRDFESPLFVHPHQLVLGATFEFIRLPTDVGAYVIGRSSLGRTGLVIATATAVAPGYAGCITLELVNLGEVPLPLFPGMRIAQLVLHATEGKARYDGRFRCSTGPQPPLLSKDHEMAVWKRASSAGAGRENIGA
jgi:dCTP deaminase